MVLKSGASSSSTPRTIFQRAIEASQLKWDNPDLQHILRDGWTCSCHDLAQCAHHHWEGMSIFVIITQKNVVEESVK